MQMGPKTTAALKELDQFRPILLEAKKTREFQLKDGANLGGRVNELAEKLLTDASVLDEWRDAVTKMNAYDAEDRRVRYQAYQRIVQKHAELTSAVWTAFCKEHLNTGDEE